MSTVHNTNQACCSIPPVKSDYVAKGSYKSYAGFTKVCCPADHPYRLRVLNCATGIRDWPSNPRQGRPRMRLRHLRVRRWELARGCNAHRRDHRFKPQTQQGADILAEKLGVQVLMPDFFEPGEPWPVDQFPPTTDEGKAQLQQFFGGTANPANAKQKAIDVGKALKAEGVEFVGLYGYCWGTWEGILSKECL